MPRTTNSAGENRTRDRRACNLPALTVRAPAALYIVPGRRTFLSTSIRPEWPSIAPSVELAGGGGYAAASLFLFSFNSSGAPDSDELLFRAGWLFFRRLSGRRGARRNALPQFGGRVRWWAILSVCPASCLAGTYSAKSEARQGQILSLALYLWVRVSLKTFFSFLRWCLILKWNVFAEQNHLEK